MNLEKIVRCLPEARLVFAYGSGIFHQNNHSKPSENMLDLVVVTDDPYKWHEKNLKSNWKHYSFLKYFGARTVARIQEKFGANVYYNTLVEINGRCVKYGVISQASLIDDLTDWNTLYISGRLHKPVYYILKDQKDFPLTEALTTNLYNAIHTALLLLPDKFAEIDLYRTVAGISYTGDFRMHVGEDRKKVDNIVATNVGRFRELYEDALQSLNEHLHWSKNKGILEQNCSPTSIQYHFNLLPKRLLSSIVKSQNTNGRHQNTPEVLQGLARDQASYRKFVSSELSKIVKASSWSQSIKGIFTAGIMKSVYYSRQKVKKYLKSL